MDTTVQQIFIRISSPLWQMAVLPIWCYFLRKTISQIHNKLYTIPYAAYTERTFRDTNIDGAQLFLSTTGVTALPLLVDPLVTYYNKDILAAKKLCYPAKNMG